MKDWLSQIVGADNVISDPNDLVRYASDFTECEPAMPDVVVFASEVEQVQAIVRRANEDRVPVTARVYGTNVGGLCIPSCGGIVLDLTRMNRIIEVNIEDMVATIEPGVTQRQLKEHLARQNIPLTFGYSLAPPETSVLANALLGGLTNRSLKYGDQSEWISGLEVVLFDGSVVRTGAWALAGTPPFGRVPFPDLTGLFVAWQGTTGIVTKMAFQLWPKHPLNRRLFFLAHFARDAFEAMRRLCRTEVCDDIGGLSWPAGRMMMGVRRPLPNPAPGEPTFFLYLDLTAETAREMAAKEEILASVMRGIAAGGETMGGPIEVGTLVKVNKAMSRFAEFPTDLDFLTAQGGLSWVGTYGPLSRFEDAAEAGTAIMVSHGLPPLIVSRPMRGGHFGVLRFITSFDKADPVEVAKVRAVNEDLLEMAMSKGFVMYKTPAWAWARLAPRFDPGTLELMRRVKALMDPNGILNPGRLGH